jgi:hypothetical protein
MLRANNGRHIATVATRYEAQKLVRDMNESAEGFAAWRELGGSIN